MHPKMLLAARLSIDRPPIAHRRPLLDTCFPTPDSVVSEKANRIPSPGMCCLLSDPVLTRIGPPTGRSVPGPIDIAGREEKRWDKLLASMVLSCCAACTETR